MGLFTGVFWIYEGQVLTGTPFLQGPAFFLFPGWSGEVQLSASSHRIIKSKRIPIISIVKQAV